MDITQILKIFMKKLWHIQAIGFDGHFFAIFLF